MFCDQDDVWFEDKISTFLVRMREVESDKGQESVVVSAEVRRSLGLDNKLHRNRSATT